jgi:hypothetical protein
MANMGEINGVVDKENAITYEPIENGNEMVNFHGEKALGRYYKKSSFNSFAKNADGVKKNPFTRALIAPGNVKKYTAKGGKRRKHRKARKTRRSKK